MNQHLQHILQFIKQNNNMTAEEKNALLKSIKDADKEFEITAFKLDRTEKVKKTTAILLEETIEELEHKQKAVEAQNRELEIEASLERVRTIAMGMSTSEDLSNISKANYNELTKLGFSEIRNSLIGIFHDDKNYFTDYDYSDFSGGSITNIPYNKNSIIDKSIQQMKSATDAFTEFIVDGTALEEWKTFRKQNGEYEDTRLTDANALYYYFYSIEQGNVGISTFKKISEEQLNILKRFRNVFDLAYKRYTDITTAEAQAREAKIETALEKIRSRSLAMHRSDELWEVIAVVFEKFQELKFSIDGAAFIVTVIEGSRDLNTWVADAQGQLYPSSVRLPYYDSPSINDIWLAKEAGLDFFSKTYSFEEKNHWLKYAFEHSHLKTIADEYKNWMLEQPFLTQCFAFGKNSMIGIHFHHQRTLAETEVDILKRFAKVFDQAYIRFLDLQKAEAQARESQIQLALERVRARTMAMQHSAELTEAANLLFRQVQSLGIPVWSCGFNIWQKNETVCTGWMSTKDALQPPFKIPLTESPTFQRFYLSKQLNEEFYTEEVKDDALEAHYRYMRSLPEFEHIMRQHLEAGFKLPQSQVNNVANFTQGNLIFITGQQVPWAWDIFKRFANVFEQTYTRFLDLQKAEAQAREAEIQLALERVRARTMSMHHSSELIQTAELLFDQLKNLGVESQGIAFAICDKDSTMVQKWTGIGFFSVPYTFEPGEQRMYEAWKNQSEIYEEVYEGERIKKYYELFMQIPAFKEGIQKFIDNGHSLPSWQKNHAITFQHGYLLIITTKPFNETQIFLRFGKVFEQTYTRFLDLQKAEAQAREAQIEAALERVRSVAMSMMKSEQLLSICEAVFKQLRILAFSRVRAAQIYLRNDEDGKFINYDYSDAGGPDVVEVNYNSHTNTKRIYEVIKGAGDSLLHNVISKQDLSEWKSYLYNTLGQPPEQALDEATELHYYLYSFGMGAFGISTFNAINNDELQILKRFRNVFSLSYQRYTDIALAEAQAREAQVEAALERVRSRTLAMQKSDELAETAAVLFQQLIALGIQPNRLYISIVKDQNGASEFWITDEDGKKISTAFDANLNDNPSFARMFEGWKLQRKSLVVDMQGEELQNYFRHLTSLGVPFKNGLSQKRRVQDIAYFSKGFIGIASPDDQPKETLQLLERFAAVFNLTFTRFNDLQIAEAHALQAEQDLIAIKEARQKAEAALTELQATQKQLIQSEKMASLGELTAGIAHEIQNPLNFVNNFSEVSKELLEEMKEAMDKGDAEEAKEIMNDVIQNLEKINHHGKRADGIVKGMLQHSRSSSTQKEPININVLADEYIRLAYHGLRAKDKSFNATLKTDFDEGIGSINIVPQDIGRVLLNLISNAFYAIDEKRKSGAEQYEPTVYVSTKTIGGKVQISVADNGNGIPQKIVDKIFQPFFTTKPTGQGTGLGLSLAYDIVKAHGGELKVETTDDEGSKFIILLPPSEYGFVK